MSASTTAQIEKNPEIERPLSLNWTDSPAVQKLLDAIISIMAEEYVEIAKQNPNIFTKGGQG